jgi:adenosyl cobinamide kinase/adenosyl cobinamide phosphate guanylyltransferase
MHFVTGGAYNGKAKWVRNHYRLDAHVQWISAYRNEPLPLHFHEDTVVLQGIEAWLKKDAHMQEAEAIRVKWQEFIQQRRIWEEEKDNRHCILIGADITKGIVPIEVENRIWRDASGWVFQDIVAASSRVDVIWYGVSQQLR